METSGPNRLRDVRFVEPLVGQALLFILAATIMDGGYIAGIVETGVLVYWMVVGWIAIRRRNALAKYDVVLIRHGYLLFSGVAILVFVGIVALGGK